MPEDEEPQDEQEPKKPERVSMKREDIQALEDAAQAAKDLPQLRKELAMVKAGIDTNTKLGQMFFKTYDGELNEDALQTAASEVGLFDQKTKTEIPTEEKGSTQERQQLNSGATAPGDNPVHPKDEAVAAAKQVIEKGGKYEHGAGAYLNTLVKRYAEGDDRAARKTNDRFRERP